MVVEIDVQPLATRCSRMLNRGANDGRADAAPLGTVRDGSVEDERVGAAVPGNVDETDQPAFHARGHPAKAVPFQLSEPVVAEHAMAESLRMQPVQLEILERTSPVVDDIQGVNLAALI